MQTEIEMSSTVNHGSIYVHDFVYALEGDLLVACDRYRFLPTCFIRQAIKWKTLVGNKIKIKLNFIRRI